MFAPRADGALVSFRTDGTPVSASPPAELLPDAVRAAGHDLAVSKDGTRVYAIVRGAGSAPDRIIVADRRSGAILATYVLADVGVYGAVTVGPTSGLLYLFGNRNGGLLLSEVDPDSGMVLASWILRGSDGLDWLVYQGAVVTDERRVYVSYHGANLDSSSATEPRSLPLAIRPANRGKCNRRLRCARRRVALGNPVVARSPSE